MKNIRDIEGLDVAGSRGYFVTSEILEKFLDSVAENYDAKFLDRESLERLMTRLHSEIIAVVFLI